MGEIVEGLDRDRVRTLLAEGRFFWADVALGNASRQEFADVLGIPEHAFGPLLDFHDDKPPSRNFHGDGEHVVFAFTAFDAGTPIEVHVLVCGGYLLTVHLEQVSLPRLLDPELPEGRSEQYLIYSVLDAMVITAFDALNDVEQDLEELQAVTSTDLRAARVRMGTLRRINSRLSGLRRRIAPQRGVFERVSEEIDEVAGLEQGSDRYFERIGAQLGRLVDGIDAAANSVAQLVDLRVNETMYWLTVVATVFLPLSFVTGFFGMNFAWMIRRLDSVVAFLVLGVGGCVLGAALTLFVVHRRGTPVEPGD